MQLVDANSKISIAELESMAAKMYGKLVKAVIDIEKEIMIIDATLHCDSSFAY